MINWKRILVPVATLALLAACGGDGGGGSGGGNLGDKSFPTAAASQTFANSVVDDVNDLIGDIREAELSGNVPVGARIVGPPIGTTYSGTFDCSEIAEGGTGTYHYRFVYKSNGDPISYEYEYHDCSYTISGYTFTMDGGLEIEYSDYEDETHNTVSTIYDMDYSFTGPNYSSSGTLQSSQICTQDGEDYECHYSVGGGYALDDYEVDIDGDITTVEYAYIVGSNASIEIIDWVYDTELERAISGTITFAYGNGDSVVISATGTGYMVGITIGVNTTDYTVTY